MRLEFFKFLNVFWKYLKVYLKVFYFYYFIDKVQIFWTLWGSGRYFPCWNLKQAERWVISWRVENFAFGRKYIHEYFGTLWFLRKGKCLRNTKTPFRPTSTAKGTAAQDLSFVLTCIGIFYWITSIFRMLYKCTKNFL